MNENLDLTKILKDCPKGTKLYSNCLGTVEFNKVIQNKYIEIVDNFGHFILYRCNGKLKQSTQDAEIDLFPSKDQRDWSKWQRPFVKGDVLVSRTGNIVICSHIDKEQVVHYHCLLRPHGALKIRDDMGVGYSYNCTLANDFQKQRLFDTLKKEGYEWDEEKKELKTLQLFKDGDIVATESGAHIFILKEFIEKTHCSKGICYIGCDSYTGEIYEEGKWCFDRIATEKEKQYLFSILKENGYEWDSESKELKKIKHKFNPKTLHHFDKVLVRQYDVSAWCTDFYSYYDEANGYAVCTGDVHYDYCIPYNEHTKHLVGKSEEAPEFYRYWKE